MQELGKAKEEWGRERRSTKAEMERGAREGERETSDVGGYSEMREGVEEEEDESTEVGGLKTDGKRRREQIMSEAAQGAREWATASRIPTRLNEDAGDVN